MARTIILMPSWFLFLLLWLSVLFICTNAEVHYHDFVVCSSFFSVAICTLYLISRYFLRAKDWIGFDSGSADTGEEAVPDPQDHYSERNVPRANP